MNLVVKTQTLNDVILLVYFSSRRPRRIRVSVTRACSSLGPCYRRRCLKLCPPPYPGRPPSISTLTSTVLTPCTPGSIPRITPPRRPRCDPCFPRISTTFTRPSISSRSVWAWPRRLRTISSSNIRCDTRLIWTLTRTRRYTSIFTTRTASGIIRTTTPS